MQLLGQVINNVFARIKTETVQTRWLKGYLYVLIKTRSKNDGIQYQWADDQYKGVGARYRSREMADVHFGDWGKD